MKNILLWIRETNKRIAFSYIKIIVLQFNHYVIEIDKNYQINLLLDLL